MHILVVEDDSKVSVQLKNELTQAGHTLVTCKGGEQAVAKVRDGFFDVVVFDTGDLDFDVLQTLRDTSRSVPQVVLSQAREVATRITAFKSGADDFVVKPYDSEELLARLDALHRRVMSAGGLRKLGNAVLDAHRHALIGSDGETRLTSREYALLAHLADRMGEPVSRSSILENVWGAEFVGEGNVVDVYVGDLRSTLRQAAAEDVRLEAVRRVGYRLVANG
jgi:DNA-binding response OmpR family regulator